MLIYTIIAVFALYVLYRIVRFINPLPPAPHYEPSRLLLITEEEDGKHRRVGKVVARENNGSDEWLIATFAGEVVTITIESENGSMAFNVRDKWTGEFLVPDAAQAFCGSHDRGRELIIGLVNLSEPSPYTLTVTAEHPSEGCLSAEGLSPGLQDASGVN